MPFEPVGCFHLYHFQVSDCEILEAVIQSNSLFSTPYYTADEKDSTPHYTADETEDRLPVEVELRPSASSSSTCHRHRRWLSQDATVTSCRWKIRPARCKQVWSWTVGLLCAQRDCHLGQAFISRVRSGYHSALLWENILKVSSDGIWYSGYETLPVVLSVRVTHRWLSPWRFWQLFFFSVKFLSVLSFNFIVTSLSYWPCVWTLLSHSLHVCYKFQRFLIKN